MTTILNNILKTLAIISICGMLLDATDIVSFEIYCPKCQHIEELLLPKILGKVFGMEAHASESQTAFDNHALFNIKIIILPEKS